MKKLLHLTLVVYGLTRVVYAANWSVDDTSSDGAFALSAKTNAAPIWVDASDYTVARISAGLFADDVQRVTGRRPTVTNNAQELAGEVVIAGTLGHSALVDRLAAENRIDVSSLRDTWENFRIALVDHPVPGVPGALVVAGSDRRGTAYGLLTLSETMGVSPWYWWADVTPAQKSAVYLRLPEPFQDGPDVKYRGLFINDEGFGGLRNWARDKIDVELKNIGPKTYAKVFELLLRLKANYCWPAMHPGTTGFNEIPENRQVADDYGIVMGSSHCEMLLRNNEAEWKKVGTYGAYNYRTNRATMVRYWEERVRTNGRFENTYTIGLRGVHDYAMEGAKTLPERVELTKLAVGDQRELLAKHVNRDLSKVPQVFCAYKEVLAIYRAGIDLPDDVTLLWADDNHGFIRNLSNPAEQQRSGGAGVYYHLSYYGDPESYLWISSISPTLIASEMGKAYAYGANRIWVFNVGDIKPAEKEFSFAMAMAWSTSRWNVGNAHTFVREWFAHDFDPETADEIAGIMAEYYRLAAATKPEQTWMVDFAPAELEARLAAYRANADRASALEARIPARLRDAYFQLVLYPVVGAARLNELHLLSRRSLDRAERGDDRALADANTARNAIPELDRLTKMYMEDIAGGKWQSIINWSPGQRPTSPSFRNTPYATPELLAAAKAAPGAVTLDPHSAQVSLPLELTAQGLRNAGPKRTTAETGGAARFTWKSDRAGKVPVWFLATSPVQWGSFKPEQNSFWFVQANGVPFVAAVLPLGNIWHALAIGPQWTRVGECQVRIGENELVVQQRDPGAVLHSIHLGLQPPPPLDPLLTVPAADFVAKHDGKAASVVLWQGIGPSGRGVSVQPFTAQSLTPEQCADAPWLDYKVSVPASAKAIEFRTLPTQRIHDGRGVRYAVSVNGGAARVVDIQADEFSAEWQQNVLHGYATRSLPLTEQGGGAIDLRVYLLDPGVILDSILVR